MALVIDLQGLVEEQPVPHLLVGLHSEEVTGVVEVREASGSASTIYLRRGSPVHVVRPDSLDRLDLVLVETGVVKDADMARAQLVRETEGILLGQALLKLGLVGDGQLTEALQHQLRRKVTRLFVPGEGTFAVTSAEHPFGINGLSPGSPIDPRALVFPGILSSYNEARLVAELNQLAGRLVRLRPVSTAQLNSLGFDHRHSPLLTHLRLAGFRLDEAWIHGSTGPRPREAKSILLALLYLDLLEFPGTSAKVLARVQTERTVAVQVRMPAAPPPPPPSSVRLTPAVPLPALRLTPAAPVPALSQPGAPLPPAPLPPVPARPTRTTTPLPPLDPLQLFTLAQQFFTKGDLARAEEAFEAVAKADGQNQRVRAFLTWIAFWKKSEEQRRTALELTLRALRDILRTEEKFAVGHYFMGALFKLQNEQVKAEQAFRTVLVHDPNMIEAQRELRLMTMRKAHR